MSKKRVGLSTKTRFEIFKRDLFACQYCGAHPPQVLLHVDHIVPVAEGGGNETENLVTACEPCNLGKGARQLSSAPESLASKASRIAEAEAQLKGYQEIARKRVERIEDEMWEVAEVLWPGSSQKGANRSDLRSIKTFVEKLGVVDVLDLAEIARAAKPYGGNRMWLYFCGCCWRAIRGD